MSTLSINDGALLAGINNHMSHLKNRAFDDSELDLSGLGTIIHPRDLLFCLDTFEQASGDDSQAHFRDAARRLMPSRREGVCSAFKMLPGCFAEKYNFDFRNVTDQKQFSRGGSQYNRPLGSMRYGLDVLDKYENNDWLGEDTGRERANGSIGGEWPVAYHGTADPSAAQIVASGGLDMGKGTRFLYGHGIYCTPDPNTALEYASPYTHNGKSYKLILQVRVDPSQREIVSKEEHGIEGYGDYWIIKKNDAIRPYGICVYPCEEEEED